MGNIPLAVLLSEPWIVSAPVVKLVYTMDLGSIPETGRGSNPLGRTTASEQASYRLLRLFSKVRAHSLRCSSFPNRTRCAGLRFGFGRKLERKSILNTCGTSGQASYRLLRLFLKVRAHSLRCSSFPNRTRCAGLRFGFGRKAEKIDFTLIACYKTDRPRGGLSYFSAIQLEILCIFLLLCLQIALYYAILLWTVMAVWDTRSDFPP